METHHFNELDEGEAERLAVLIEECSEVQRVACKILRHGYESTNNEEMPDSNREQLERELGHLAHASSRLVAMGDVNDKAIEQSFDAKVDTYPAFIHHDMRSC